MESQKDTNPNLNKTGLTDTKIYPSVRRAEKLVTAIFMVSDLMDKAEPLRTQLRSLSLKLLSDSNPLLISQIMSLINISNSIGLISDMNAGILIKELTNMKDSIPTLENLNFNTETLPYSGQVFSRTISQGHVLPKQNNGVLYKTPTLSVKRNPIPNVLKTTTPNESKSDRRQTIIKLIKEKREVTIKDISSNISGCSEKTIQRELISLLKDKVIEKTGEKRWSRYFLSRNS
jgi:hypothetical protein